MAKKLSKNEKVPARDCKHDEHDSLTRNESFALCEFHSMCTCNYNVLQQRVNTVRCVIILMGNDEKKCVDDHNK